MAEEGRTLGFRFTGRASEYFRIWVIGVALSWLTLGVYSAWAKVRTQQYFYRHTWLDGSSFEYVAEPRAILLGRLLLALALVVLFALQLLHVGAAAVALLLLLAITPWVVDRAVSFRARSSRFRNVSAGFDSSLSGVYRVFFKSYLATLLSLGFGYPHARQARTAYVVDGLSHGDARIVWRTVGSEYFAAYKNAALLLLPAFALEWAEKHVSGLGGTLLRLLAFVWVLVPSVYLRQALANLLYDGMWIGTHRLRSRQRFWPLCALYVTNTLLVLGTLGVAIPWASIRLARYRVETLELELQGPLEVRARHEPARRGTYGEAAADLGGVDIGLG
jgi:uncharacterized membrane protein YjgN (DUF898 family)